MDPSELLTREQAAKLLGRTPRTLYAWQAKSYGPMPFHVGPGRGRVAYLLDDLRGFLEAEYDRAANEAEASEAEASQ